MDFGFGFGGVRWLDLCVWWVDLQYTSQRTPPPIGFDADADTRYEAIEPDEKAARPGRPTVELFALCWIGWGLVACWECLEGGKK